MGSEKREQEKPQGVPAIDISALMASADAAELTRALRDPNGPLRDTLEAVRAAATDWGVFYVTNHGVPRDELARVRRASRTFFALPRRTKHRVRRRIDNSRGYFDGNLASDRADRSESFAVAGPHEDIAPRARRVERLFANDQNQWLADAVLPGFQPTLTAHYASMQRIARRLLMLLAVALGERIDFFDQFFHGERVASVSEPLAQMLSEQSPIGNDVAATAAAHANSSVLELTHYPVARDPEWTLCVHHYADAGALTVRLQDAGDGGDSDDGATDSSSDADSLQVLHRASQTWYAVAPRRNALVVTVGELLQLWSNDVLIAPLHRVFASEGASRHTTTFCYRPSYNALAQPIVADKDARAKYRPLHWLTYLIAQIDGSFTDTDEDAHISGYRMQEI